MSKTITASNERLLPTGTCWCGCGEDAPIGSFFLAGHDKRAEAGVILAEYGSVAAFLRAHGFGPGGKSACAALRKHKEHQDDAKQAVHHLRQQAKRSGASKITRAEIDQEIAIVRRRRRKE